MVFSRIASSLILLFLPSHESPREFFSKPWECFDALVIVVSTVCTFVFEVGRYEFPMPCSGTNSALSSFHVLTHSPVPVPVGL